MKCICCFETSEDCRIFCKCKGEWAFWCLSCLEKWIEKNGLICEGCNAPYRLPKSRFDIFGLIDTFDNNNVFAFDETSKSSIRMIIFCGLVILFIYLVETFK